MKTIVKTIVGSLAAPTRVQASRIYALSSARIATVVPARRPPTTTCTPIRPSKRSASAEITGEKP